MLIIYIFIIAFLVGCLPIWFKFSERLGLNILLGFIGSLLGAFLSFGDTSFFLKFGLWVDPLTMPIIFSIIAVAISVIVENKSNKNKKPPKVDNF